MTVHVQCLQAAAFPLGALREGKKIIIIKVKDSINFQLFVGRDGERHSASGENSQEKEHSDRDSIDCLKHGDRDGEEF